MHVCQGYGRESRALSFKFLAATAMVVALLGMEAAHSTGPSKPPDPRSPATRSRRRSARTGNSGTARKAVPDRRQARELAAGRGRPAACARASTSVTWRSRRAAAVGAPITITSYPGRARHDPRPPLRDRPGEQRGRSQQLDLDGYNRAQPAEPDGQRGQRGVPRQRRHEPPHLDLLPARLARVRTRPRHADRAQPHPQLRSAAPDQPSPRHLRGGHGQRAHHRQLDLRQRGPRRAAVPRRAAHLRRAQRDRRQRRRESSSRASPRTTSWRTTSSPTRSSATTSRTSSSAGTRQRRAAQLPVEHPPRGQSGRPADRPRGAGGGEHHHRPGLRQPRGEGLPPAARAARASTFP